MLVFPSSRRHKNCVFCQFLDDLPPPNPAYITSLRISWVEYGEDIVNAMSLDKLERTEASLGHLLRDLRQQFQAWQKSDSSPSM